MTPLRAFLSVSTVAIFAVTTFAVVSDGINWPAVFLGDLLGLDWRTQFNTDFLIHLVLLATWIGAPMKPTDLMAHPEGGRFREVFRSTAKVTTESGDGRSALTHIYFRLDPGEFSRFHRVSSDEVWNLYEGVGLRLHLWDGTNDPPNSIELSASSGCFCHVIPAGTWQAAEPISGTVLVGCSVAPGFEFEDFELIQPGSDQAKLLESLDPAMSKYTVR